MLALNELCDRLAKSQVDQIPLVVRLKWCVEAGVFRWFIPQEHGGWGWDDAAQLDGYLSLSQADMTTAFVLTQWNAACKRLMVSHNTELTSQWLPGMARGEVFATVGISHLTTSRQYASKPVLMATEQADGSYKLDGFSPWVTAGALADVLVIGASTADGRQILCAVPAERAGISIGPGVELMALSESATDAVHFDSVSVQASELLAGPVENVMQAGGGGGAGGLQTSTLALGLTQAAVDFLQHEAQQRPDLQPIADKLATDVAQLREVLLKLATGAAAQRGDEPWTAPRLREQANSLVLRSTQAALGAAKGAGFVATHPAGRWCREALFFLVWSCPQPVLAANLCEFAQV